MESDERFKHLASDPRFKPLRRKQKKVQIDDRFQSMFTDEKFTLKYSRDKRGRKQKKTSGDDLKKYYELEGNEPVKSKRNDKVIRVVEEKGEKENNDNKESEYDAKDQHKGYEKETSAEDDAPAGMSNGEKENSEIEDGGEEEVDGPESESEVSSSSDEADTDDEGIDKSDDDRLALNNIKYDWQPLDHDAETAETTFRRIAIQNLDWDRLDVKDIYTLVNSVRPPMSVRIYVSEFGKDRLNHERLEGPREIIEMTKVDEVEEEYQCLKEKIKTLKNPGLSLYKFNEYEDADEELDLKNDEIRERVRRYQLSKMKYYYAVAEFDSVETAELVYKELDGMEYEGSSLELDLRFIPDDIEFDPEDIHSECDKVSDLTSYQAPQFINSALQQTTVKFTWDETDVKRQEKLNKSYTKQELDKDDLDAYLASGTDSDEDEDDTNDGDDVVSVVTANSEARINKYKMLLRRLDDEAAKKKKVDVDIEWGNYSEDEEKLCAAAQETDKSEEEDDEEGDFYENDDHREDGVNSNEKDISDDEDEIDNEVREQTKRQRKPKGRKSKNKKGEKRVEFSKSQDAENDGLDLLVMDNVDSRHGKFKFNPEDERFKAVYESAAYNIDPSHPNFKRTQAFDMMAEKKREKRQKTSV